jgi:2-dehydropantoate 2-reductase
MRIAVLGAGGVGGCFGGALARAGHAVAFLARGPHLDAIRARGLEVRSPGEAFTAAVEAADGAEALGARDFAIVAVKTYSLAEVAPAARLLAERGAVILPLLNGVEAAGQLVASGVPEGQVLGGLAHISAVKVGPGVVERKSPFQRVALGERAGSPTDRVRAIVAAFQGAGIEARASEDISADLWRKLAFIASMAAACGLARSPVGPVRDALYGRLLFERAVREVLAVARARGIRVAADDAAPILALVDSLGGALKPSLLVDLESGRATELDDLNGAVSRLGREAGVETPIHDTAVAALSAATAAPSGARKTA